MFLLVRPSVLVIIYDPSNFQDLSSLGAFISFKSVSKVAKLDVGKTQIKSDWNKIIIISLCSFKLI